MQNPLWGIESHRGSRRVFTGSGICEIEDGKVGSCGSMCTYIHTGGAMSVLARDWFWRAQARHVAVLGRVLPSWRVMIVRSILYSRPDLTIITPLSPHHSKLEVYALLAVWIPAYCL